MQLRPAALSFALSLPLIGCSGDSSSAPSDVPTSTATDAGSTPDTAAVDVPAVDVPAVDVLAGGTGCVVVARTCAQLGATFPTGNANVSVTCDEAAGTFTITSTGVPNYTSNQTTPNAIGAQGWVAVLPLVPGCAAAPTSVIASRGEVGFMVNGVPFYGPQDAEGRDALVFEGSSFDDCVGHADMRCSYHYHTEPRCVFGVGDPAANHPQADGHPPVIGYALDGFAIHSSYAAAATHGPLDGCNGHADAARGYHYHATATSSYLIGCYAGRAIGRVTRSMALCSMGTPDAGVAPDAGATMGPRACTSSSECAGACPAGSIGCTCATTPMGMRCVPTCNSNTDCPTGPMGALTCNVAMHQCVPAMGM
jgi:hypothetical protein